MTAEHIIGIYVVIEETMGILGHTSHRLAGASDAEVLMVAVAAAFYGNHHARTLAVLRATGYLSRTLSTSRFSRRVHALADWLVLLLAVLGDLFAQGPAAICDFIIDSMPVPVCKRVRARRCRTVRGRAYCGYCADVLWLAAASGLHDHGPARRLHPVAGRLARPHAHPRVDGRTA